MKLVRTLIALISFMAFSTLAMAQGVPNIQNWTAQPGYANSVQQQLNALKNNLGPPPSAGNAGDFLMSNGTIANYYAMSGDISCSTVTPGLCTVTSTGTSSLVSIILPNAASTGTTPNKLVKLTGAPSTGVVMSTTDTSNALGVCISNCGTSASFANATVQILGLTQCVFDGATTAGDAFTISTTTAGDCHDTGSVTPPGNPQQALGYVLSTNASGGTYTAFINNVGILSAAVPPTNFLLANAGVTGTTVNKLVKFTGAPSTGVITATTDTNNAIGLCTSGCGTTGTAVIQYDGTANCVFDGATTAGDAVTISATTAGDCHDTGSTIPPTATEPVGFVLSTNGGGGTYKIYFSTINGALAGSNFGTILVPNRVTTASASLSVALASSINQFISLHDSITLTFSSTPPDGYVVRFKLTQTNGGSHTVSWPATVKWPSGTAPTLTTINGQADFVQCLFDATTTNYDCSSVLNFTP